MAQKKKQGTKTPPRRGRNAKSRVALRKLRYKGRFITSRKLAQIKGL